MKPVTFHTDIVLVDMIGFSKLSDQNQFRSAQIMDSVLRNEVPLLSSFESPNTQPVIGFIPTGDGFYCILHPGVRGYGVLFAFAVRAFLLMKSKKAGNLFSGVRVAAGFGSAMPIKDVTNRLNFIGSGLNNTARLLTLTGNQLQDAQRFAGDSNILLASDGAIHHFRRRYPETLPANQSFLESIKFEMSEQFVVIDKHGGKHPCTSIEMSGFAAISAPPMGGLSVGEIAEVDTQITRILQEPSR